MLKGDLGREHPFDNRLAAVVGLKGETIGYAYDAMGRRVRKITGDKAKDTVTYLYDGLEVLQEIAGQKNQKITAYYRSNGLLVARQGYNISQGKGSTGYQHRLQWQLEYYAHDG